MLRAAHSRRGLIRLLGLGLVGSIAGCSGNGSPTGSQSQPAGKLAPETIDADDFLGQAVAMAGDGGTALVGAGDDEDPNRGKAGSVYVFSRTDGSWSHRTKLAAADGDENDRFGSAGSLGGGGATALVGARYDEDPNRDGSGAAYVVAL